MSKCYSCLKETNDSFCGSCRKKLFNGKKVSHILPFTRPEFNEIRLTHSNKLSISGVQVKYSLSLRDDKLKLTEKGGGYIIKPVPYGPFKNMEFVPANEHLTMQIAAQVFNINIPPNALMLFGNDEPTYIVKRFDVVNDDKKLLQEDFAQLANKTEESGGRNYKYDFSYEEMAELMRKYIPAYPVEIEKFYSLVLFNYLIGNGDAHLKNFSVSRNEKYGDYTLTPAYDLMNTKLHVPTETDTALELFKNGYMTESYKAGSKYTREDFIVFGQRLGVNDKRINFIIDKFISNIKGVEDLVRKSFLSEELKSQYLEIVNNRIDRLRS
jgi:serine/threonine-protein kinase HipA